MRLTAKKLIDVGCCPSGVRLYFEHRDRKVWDAEKLFEAAIGHGDNDLVAWAIASLMPYNQRLEWAIWCAERVIHVWENYSNNLDPQEAIEAAQRCLKDRSPKNIKRAYDAYLVEAHNAYDVVGARYAADTASITANIARSDPNDTADNTVEAAHFAANSIFSRCDEYDNWAEEHTKILRKGLEILLELEEQGK